MKGCRAIRRLVLRESDERLSVEQAFLLEEHLERCADCRRFRDVELEIRQALAQREEPSLSGAVLEQAVAGVCAALAREDRPAGSLALRRGLQAAGVAALLGAGALVFWRAERPTALPVARNEDPATFVPDPEGAPDPEVVPETASTLASASPSTPAELRERLRSDLSEAFSGWTPDQDPAAAVKRFAERTAALSASWQIERFVEELVAEPDGALACAASRVLGARGDRLSAPALRSALARADVAPSAMAALAELGPGGLAVLAEALADPALEPLALRALGQVGGEESAEVLERALAASVGPARDAQRTRELAALGAPALPRLLRLAEHDRGRAGLFLGALEQVPGAAEALVPLLRTGQGSSELRYEAALRLPSAGALAWLRERCLEREERGAALAALARWEGVEALEVALELSASGKLDDEKVETLVTRLLESDANRARVLASELVAGRSGAADTAEELLELLLACGVARTGAACALLTGAELPEDQRLLAALAAGELGEPGDLQLIASAFQRTDPRERRLRAALLLSIHRLCGEEGVVLALAGSARGEAWSGLLQALEQAAERGAGISIQRVARALDAVATRPKDPWRST